MNKTAYQDANPTVDREAIMNRLFDGLARIFAEAHKEAGQPEWLGRQIFRSEAVFLDGRDVAARSCVQIYKQLHPMLTAFGWEKEVFVGIDMVKWWGPLHGERHPWGGVIARLRRQQPILTWRASDPLVIELKKIDGTIEVISGPVFLMLALAQLGARSDMGKPKDRTLSRAVLECVKRHDAKQPTA